MTNLQKYNLLKATLLRKFSTDAYHQKVDEEVSFLVRHNLLKEKDIEKERGFKLEKDRYRSAI